LHCNKYVIARPGPLSSGPTIFFADPAGNNFAVYVPTVEEHNGTTERLTGVGYLELEAPNLDASIKFYEQVLGFKVLERGRDAQSNKT
jgi:catechol-2,3-dioxygenase